MSLAFRSEPERAWAVYGASKAQSEQAAWKFMDEKKPHFVFNSILPNANFGPVNAISLPEGSDNKRYARLKCRLFTADFRLQTSRWLYGSLDQSDFQSSLA